MASIQKISPIPQTVKPAIASVAATNGTGTYVLPSEKSAPKERLGEYSWLIYGEKKIGKTSLASKFPDALFFMFEPGGKGLEIYQVQINKWEDFKGYVKALKTTDKYETVVIDTINIAYEMCMAYVGRQHGFEHPSENNDFGQSWKRVSTEFEKVILDLVSTGRGVMFISHAVASEFIRPNGKTFNKIVPSMASQAQKFVSAFVDIIAYYGYYGSDRFLTIQGEDTLESGHRIEKRFLVKDTNEKVHSIPMGNSADEAYQNILTAFVNKQEIKGEPTEETGIIEKKPMGRGKK